MCKESMIMVTIQLGLIESRFADIIWENEPITSTKLVQLASVEFGWKRTTTHTVIKRLCDKGLFKKDKGTVYALITKEDFYSKMSKELVDNNFNGSLPYFISCFTKNEKLSKNDIDLIRLLLKESRE